ncbi:MAG TPA: 50S ribosomal protein L22 [Candidatus Paceibacterota bacterium]|nr:50S ribosomal protein L22 [Candidatus Paceibacterota bacterium]
MEIKANLNYLRIAPRKVRSVIDLIRGKEIKEAEAQLKFISRRAAAPVLKLVKSAIANAKNNFNLEKENLFIKEIRVDEGVPNKRWMPVSRGRAHPIMKRTSHINLVLGVKEGVKIKKAQPVKSIEMEETPKEAPSATVVSTQKPEKPKYRPPKEIKKGKGFIGSIAKKVFRRKSM